MWAGADQGARLVAHQGGEPCPDAFLAPRRARPPVPRRPRRRLPPHTPVTLHTSHPALQEQNRQSRHPAPTDSGNRSGRGTCWRFCLCMASAPALVTAICRFACTSYVDPFGRCSAPCQHQRREARLRGGSADLHAEEDGAVGRPEERVLDPSDRQRVYRRPVDHPQHVPDLRPPHPRSDNCNRGFGIRVGWLPECQGSGSQGRPGAFRWSP